MVARLDTAAHAELRKVVVELSYKNGAKRITTRLPVIEVILVADDMFSQDMSVEILLEAQDSKGNVVGDQRLDLAVLDVQEVQGFGFWKNETRRRTMPWAGWSE